MFLKLFSVSHFTSQSERQLRIPVGRKILVSCPGQEKQMLTWVFGTYECLVGLLLNRSCRILSDYSCNDVSVEKRWLVPSYIWDMAQDFAFPLQAVNRQEGVTYPALKLCNWHFLPSHSVSFTYGICHVDCVLVALFSRLSSLQYLIFFIPLSFHPISKLAHLLVKCDCFRIFLLLIIF